MELLRRLGALPLAVRALSVVAALALAMLAAAPPAAAQPVGEYAVKAAFLFNFTKFVEWPAEGFAAPDAPFRICVVGDDPFDGALAATVAGERAARRRLVAEHHRRPETAGACQIVFLAGDDDADLLDRLPAAGAGGRLLVGESAAFLRAGGHFRFRLAGGRVRLSVNLRALETTRLRVSSRLLRLAEIEVAGNT